jgi:hypothetical protein
MWDGHADISYSVSVESSRCLRELDDMQAGTFEQISSRNRMPLASGVWGLGPSPGSKVHSAILRLVPLPWTWNGVHDQGALTDMQRTDSAVPSMSEPVAWGRRWDGLSLEQC